MKISEKNENGIRVIIAENSQIKIEVVPDLGGKLLSIFNKLLQKEFLWRNDNLLLSTHQPGDDYDSNFIGGIDELIPNDIPETVDSVELPDHGELWTTSLKYEIKDNLLSLTGVLKQCGLFYRKEIYLDEGSPVIHFRYKIKNEAGARRHFLWKLHAALRIEAGDRLITDAKKARVVDLDYSRFSNTNEFDWPEIQNVDASVVPPKDGSVDFFYLYNIDQGKMDFLNTKNNHLFRYVYDKKIFPFQWYFASYGGFLGHNTVILEPCSAMPISINSAKDKGQCTVLDPGQEMETYTRIYAGENI
jgi:hypothetical protein